jgi:DNA invertase Pin-like site-specific DNA recombinase
MLSEIVPRIEKIIGDKHKAAAVMALIEEAEHREKSQRFQKQIDGIAAAKERGVQFGRPLMDFPKNFAKICKKQQEGMLTVTEASRALNISRQQFYRLRKRYEEQQHY